VKYLLLGLVQGITEPLPISSSGHVIVFDHLLGINIIDINFEIIINFASFLAIIWFFRKDIATLVSNIIRNRKDEELSIKYVFKLAVASLPAVILGLLFMDYIDAKLMSLITVGISFIFTGILLAYANTFKNRYDDTDITYKNSFFIGLMQMVALIPGISRSGATLSGGLLSKKDTKSVLRFSFFMYMIVSLGSMVLMVRDLNLENIFLSGYIGAFIVSMMSCYIALKWFYNLILKRSLRGFAIYCLLLGLAIVILSL
jgi:undecaprenyl-diphosphatase